MIWFRTKKEEKKTVGTTTSAQSYITHLVNDIRVLRSQWYATPRAALQYKNKPCVRFSYYENREEEEEEKKKIRMLEKDSTPAGRSCIQPITLFAHSISHNHINPPMRGGWMSATWCSTLCVSRFIRIPWRYNRTENNELRRRSGTAGIKPTSFSPFFSRRCCICIVSFHASDARVHFILPQCWHNIY